MLSYHFFLVIYRETLPWLAAMGPNEVRLLPAWLPWSVICVSFSVCVWVHARVFAYVLNWNRVSTNEERERGWVHWVARSGLIHTKGLQILEVMHWLCWIEATVRVWCHTQKLGPRLNGGTARIDTQPATTEATWNFSYANVSLRKHKTKTMLEKTLLFFCLHHMCSKEQHQELFEVGLKHSTLS